LEELSTITRSKEAIGREGKGKGKERDKRSVEKRGVAKGRDD